MRGLFARLRDDFARITIGIGADRRCLPQALRGAFRRHGLALRAHSGNRRRQRFIRQRHALDADLADIDAIDLQHARGDLLAESLLKGVEPHLVRVDIYEIREIEIARDDVQRSAHEAAQLHGRLIGLIAHRAQELAHPLRIVRHLPGNVGLHQDAQPIARADVLQSSGGRAQAQIDGIVLSNGAGSFHASPGSVTTRTGLPKRVITPASPAGTMTMQAAAIAASRISAATPMRRPNLKSWSWS